jgi:hypothetical protein
MILMIYNMIQKEKFLFLYWKVFLVCSYIFHIITALYIVNFIENDYTKIYLERINDITKIIISVYLIWCFRYFRKNIKFTRLDQSVVYHCAIFLLLTTTLNQIIIYYSETIKKTIREKTAN